MSSYRHDCAAVDAAFDEFLTMLAAAADEQAGERRTGVSDHDRGRAYLAQLTETFDSESLGGWEDRWVGGRRLSSDKEVAQVRAARAALATLTMAVEVSGGMIANACVACGARSDHRYCVECARELNLEAYDNPRHKA